MFPADGGAGRSARDGTGSDCAGVASFPGRGTGWLVRRVLAGRIALLVENSAIAVDLVFHAGCWYSLMSPASLGRSWIRSVRTGKGSTSGSSFGARRAMP